MDKDKFMLSQDENLYINTSTRHIISHGEKIGKLSPMNAILLGSMAATPGELCSFKELFDSTRDEGWALAGDKHDISRIVDDRVKELKEKLREFNLLAPKKEKDKGIYIERISGDGGGYVIHLPINSPINNLDTNDDPAEEYHHVAPLSGVDYCEQPILCEKLDKAFNRDRMVFIYGMSGMGKSELARYYAMKRNFRRVIPLTLQSNGQGDMDFLLSQVQSDEGENGKSPLHTLQRLEEDDLIIIDNYNDIENQVIINFAKKVCRAKLLITSQISQHSFRELNYEAVGIEQGLDEENKKDFTISLFCRYAGIDVSSMLQGQKQLVEDIVCNLQYHTMIICMLGRQYRKGFYSLESLRNSIEKDVVAVLKRKIKVSIRKDDEQWTMVPYEVMKLLFQNQLISRDFDEMERQVLGALVICEKYTDSLPFLCELIGDSENYLSSKAKEAFYSLDLDGMISLQNERVYIHPLIRELICDPELVNGETVAKLNYDFHIHILRNKLVEGYSLYHPEAILGARKKEREIWHTWVLEEIKEHIIPRMMESEDFRNRYEKEAYVIAICQSKNGSSVYIRFESGKEYCLLNGSSQKKEEFRYYVPGTEPPEEGYDVSQIIENYYVGYDTIVLPEMIGGASVKVIGRGAFLNNKMRYLILPNKLKVVNDYAFCDCTNLEEIILPDSVWFVGSRAFKNCMNAHKLVLSNSLIEIAMGAFSDCKKVKGEIVVPDSVKRISGYAFYECGAESIKLPSELERVGQYSFSKCTRLQSIQFGEGMAYISKGMFSECNNLERIHIPHNIKEIGAEAFACCENLKSIYMDEGVETIGNGAFAGCQRLERAELPDSILKLGAGIFDVCPKAEIVVEEGSLPEKLLLYYCETARRTYYIRCKENKKDCNLGK